MSEPQKPFIVAIEAEIHALEQQLEILRAAHAASLTDRAPRVRIIMAGDQIAIDQLFDTPERVSVIAGNGSNGSPAAVAVPSTNPRENTARLLAQFDRRSVTALDDALTRAGLTARKVAVGVLVKNKYLKRKSFGFLRTAKPFVP
jgi:hypothetical protein